MGNSKYWYYTQRIISSKTPVSHLSSVIAKPSLLVGVDVVVKNIKCPVQSNVDDVNVIAIALASCTVIALAS